MKAAGPAQCNAYTSNAASDRAGQNITSGGASDTELSEFTVMPTSERRRRGR